MPTAITLGFQFFYQLRKFGNAAASWQSYRARYTFTEEGITSESELGMSRFAWKAFDKLWQTPTAWILFMRGQPSLAMPSERLDEELKQFITRKIVESGGSAVR